TAPKFPQAPVLELLWRAGLRTGDDALFAPVETTLTCMSRGGIWDHLGGGFARYSVDARWHVPHFEKMLYDNAQLLALLALAHARTGDPLYRDRATSIVAWLDREMTIAGGAFAASLDADSDGAEGKFYTWTLDEITGHLGPGDGACSPPPMASPPPAIGRAPTSSTSSTRRICRNRTGSDSNRCAPRSSTFATAARAPASTTRSSPIGMA
ncbi:MAG: thioredoxin domain-containing protein, partial [Methylacidiphilales bacterium]|nr:thioredoxin domain-containing protein [Candidatus Methylacidiphilales bacterium]